MNVEGRDGSQRRGRGAGSCCRNIRARLRLCSMAACHSTAIATVAFGWGGKEITRTFSPLTPALSPLRGEGVAQARRGRIGSALGAMGASGEVAVRAAVAAMFGLGCV